MDSMESINNINNNIDLSNTCTEYKVSTITCNGSLGCKIDLDALYDAIEIQEKQVGFVWSKLGDGNQKGTHPKTRKPRILKKMFDNQMTIVYWFRERYHPNIKVFRNGNIQMTGIKTPGDGEFLVQHVANEAIRLNEIRKTNGQTAVLADGDVPTPSNFIIRMINSDFTVPFKIRRKDLFMLIVNKYGKSCNFQAETYPGVKLQYYYNTMNSGSDCGTCTCIAPCFGKDKGQGDGKCKKVTVAIFQSGKVLITGSNSFEQVDEAYRFIKQIIMENKEKIHWVPPVLPVAN